MAGLARLLRLLLLCHDEPGHPARSIRASSGCDGAPDDRRRCGRLPCRLPRTDGAGVGGSATSQVRPTHTGAGDALAHFPLDITTARRRASLSLQRQPAPQMRPSPKSRGRQLPGAAARKPMTMTGLLQVGNGGQVELAGHNEDLAAPVGAEPEQIDRGEAAVEPRGVVTGEGVAVTLVQAGVVVAEVQREHALGETEADVPGGVAGIGNAVGERRDAGPAGAGAVEAVAGAEEPVTDFG